MTFIATHTRPVLGFFLKKENLKTFYESYPEAKIFESDKLLNASYYPLHQSLIGIPDISIFDRDNIHLNYKRFYYPLISYALNFYVGKVKDYNAYLALREKAEKHRLVLFSTHSNKKQLSEESIFREIDSQMDSLSKAFKIAIVDNSNNMNINMAKKFDLILYNPTGNHNLALEASEFYLAGGVCHCCLMTTFRKILVNKHRRNLPIKKIKMNFLVDFIHGDTSWDLFRKYLLTYNGFSLKEVRAEPKYHHKGLTFDIKPTYEGNRSTITMNYISNMPQAPLNMHVFGNQTGIPRW